MESADNRGVNDIGLEKADVEDLVPETREERYRVLVEEVKNHKHRRIISIDQIAHRNRGTAASLAEILGAEVAFLLFSKDW